MTQLHLPLPRAYVPVTLGCPKCGHEFLGGIHQPRLTWLKESHAQTAKQCFCPACKCAPPMVVVAKKEAAA